MDARIAQLPCHILSYTYRPQPAALLVDIRDFGNLATNRTYVNDPSGTSPVYMIGF